MENESVETVETETVETEQNEVTEQEEKKFTQEEVDKLIKERLSRKDKKFAETLEKEKAEAERMAKMSEQERLEAEFEKEKAEFERQKQEYNRERMELKALKKLSEKDLPVEFSTYVIAENEDGLDENISNLKEVWDNALEEAIKKRIQGKTPKVESKVEKTMTKDEFDKMTYTQKLNLFNENPDLYNKLK